MKLSSRNVCQTLVVFMALVFIAACASTTSEPAPPPPEPEVSVVVAEAEVEASVETAPVVPEVNMPTANIQFAFDSAAVTGDESVNLQKWASYLSASDISEIEVHGHTDTIGTEEYNLELSAKRARATALELQELADKPLVIREIAHGELEPLASGQDEESHRQNRRVEIALP